MSSKSGGFELILVNPAGVDEAPLVQIAQFLMARHYLVATLVCEGEALTSYWPFSINPDRAAFTA
jgi:hypothetical protein